MTRLVAVVLFAAVVVYAVFAGADYGAGFWDLTAGGAQRGERIRGLVDRSVGPVWEANHTWLIFALVVMWTGFPRAFAAITTTLYIPLGLAALGIVLRGSGFAFRHVAGRPHERHVASFAFGASSVLTPFFFGTVVGGLASGRVPSAGNGNALRSWVNPTSLLAGTLAVAVAAYLAALFLAADARNVGDRSLEQAFRGRAFGAAAVAGGLAAGGVAVLHSDAHRLFEHLFALPGISMVVVSVVAGLGALALIRRSDPRVVRGLGVLAVAAVVTGWGVAQYPYLLGTHLPLRAASAPQPTLVSLVVVVGAVAVLVLPSLVLLFVMQQRGRLEPR